MIEQTCVEKIIEAARIEEVVSDFVTLRKRGANLIGLCPFHNERTPSFTVSPAKNIFKCFGCGEGGTPVHFVMKHEQLDFVGALRYLAAKYHIEVVETKVDEEEMRNRNEREGRFAVNEFALSFFEQQLWNTEEGKAVGLSYFHERGFTDPIIKKFRLGYSPEKRDALYLAAKAAGHNEQYLFDTGLCSKTDDGHIFDRFRGRVMFPVFGVSGKVVAFGGRVLQKTDRTAKYVNSPESEIYHKSRELYGLFLAKPSIVKQDKCYLVEGYTDVMSMHQSGIENVVASSGTSLTEGQISLIHRFTSNIVVLYDGDSAGIKASLRGIDLLLKDGMNVKVVLLPEGEDPDSFAKSQDSSQFQAYLQQHETDFIRFKTDLLLSDAGDDPVKRATIMSDIIASIAVIPDAMLRSVYIKDYAQSFNISEAMLTAEVAKKRGKNLSDGKVKAKTPERDLAKLTKADEVFTFKEERVLMAFLIEAGDNVICMKNADGEEFEMTVRDFICQCMEDDEREFADPLHAKIFEEYRNLQGGYREYFLNHPDLQIQKYVFSLTDSIGILPEDMENGRGLAYYVERAIWEYRSRIVDKEVKELQQKIKTATPDEIPALLEEQKQLNQMRLFLAKQLGGRTISRV